MQPGTEVVTTKPSVSCNAGQFPLLGHDTMYSVFTARLHCLCRTVLNPAANASRAYQSVYLALDGHGPAVEQPQVCRIAGVSWGLAGLRTPMIVDFALFGKPEVADWQSVLYIVSESELSILCNV